MPPLYIEDELLFDYSRSMYSRNIGEFCTALLYYIKYNCFYFGEKKKRRIVISLVNLDKISRGIKQLIP